MDNLNNTNNPNNLNDNLNMNGTKMTGTSIGVIIGLVVFVGAIIATVKLGMDSFEKFKEVSKKLDENIANNLEQKIPDYDFNGDDLVEDKGDYVENEEDNVTNEEDKEQIDPYAKHKNITFAGTKETNKNITIFIENGKIYSKESGSNKRNEWKVKGTPKKLLFNPPAVSAIVLTEEGKVYEVSYDVYEEISELSKYTIVDIARINNYTYESIYYLTSEGKLIDVNGVAYDKYNFVNMVGYGKMWQIPVDKNNYGYHYDYDKDEFVVITNSSKAKVSFAKI